MAVDIGSLDHLVLTVADIERTCNFYADVLGFDIVAFGDNRVALSFGHQKINLHQLGAELDPAAAVPTAGSADLCFLTATPIDEVVDHVEGCGIEIVDGPVVRTGAGGPILSIYFRDPDGNLLEVSNPAQ